MMRRSVMSLLLLFAIVDFAAAQNCPRGMVQITGPASYVATPCVQALNLTRGFTIECWVQASAETHAAGIIDKGIGPFSSYGIFIDTGSRFFGGVRRTSQIKTVSLPIDSFYHWHHIAYVYRPGDSIYLYIDSAEAASTSAKVIPNIDSSTDSIRIGSSVSGMGLLGSIDELRIWNAPRSLAQIRSALYGIVAPDPALVLYYPFDDVSGSPQVRDFSGNRRDGFLKGAYSNIVLSTSPVLDAAPGWRLAAREQSIVIPTRHCSSAFDTVIHIYNVGPRPDTVKSYAFFAGRAFSITSNFPIPMPADSSRSISIVLHFEPNIGGVFDDTLSIIDSTECGGKLKIGVHAAYDEVGLTFKPPVLNFGSVLSCKLPVMDTVRVTNLSATDPITIVAPSLPAGLTMSNKFPRTLGPSESMVDTFILLPGARGLVSMQAGLLLDKCSRIAQLTITAVRQQPELSVPKVIDFGSVAADLGGITRDTMIVVRNTGNVTTGIQSIVFSDTSLTVTDGRINILKDTVQIHLHLHPVTCGQFSATLHIKDVVCGSDTTVTVRINIIPPDPLVVPSFDVGRVCGSGSVRRVVTLYNTNDKPVRLDTTIFSKINIFFTPPLYPYNIPAHDSVSLEFLFDPAVDGDYIDTAYLHTSPCGVAITVLKGSRGYTGVQFGPSLLSFGHGCDISPVTKTVTLRNSSSRSVTVTDTVQYGSKQFVIAPIQLPFTLLPGDSTRIDVKFSPVLARLDTGSFHLIGSEGCQAAALTMRGSRELAHAEFNLPLLEFDTVCKGSSKTLSVQLHNLGLDTIDVIHAYVSGVGFSLDSTPAFIANNGTIEIRYSSILPQQDSGTVVVELDACGTKLLLPLRGSGGPVPQLVIADSVLNFGFIEVDDSVSICINVANPSCMNLSAAVDTSGLGIFSAPTTTFSVVSGDTVQLCFQYKPIHYGDDTRTLMIASDSAPTRIITLRGTGLAPDVRSAERVLDFGYVLRDSSVTRFVHLSNVGNEQSALSVLTHHAEYVANAPATIAPNWTDSIAITFGPTKIGLVVDTFLVTWDRGVDTVILRGQGTEKGMIPSATLLDFGDVHVSESRTLPLYITATQDFPTVQSVQFTSGSSPTFSVSASLPHTIKDDHDSLIISLQYSPTAEQRDTAFLTIYDGATRDTVMLTGRGVEAHVEINPVKTDYGKVTIGSSLALRSLRVKNVGTYPLFVNSLQIGPDFQADAGTITDAILPDSERYYTITFLPTRARHVVDSLHVFTSSPDKLNAVAFEGTGVYPAGTGPSFGYSVAATQTQPGERDTIPVSMFGTRLSKIDADSVLLRLTFDPSMIWMHGVVSNNVTRWKQLNDSTIEIEVTMNQFGLGPIFSLDAEALLGPNPTSYIHVVISEPTADIAQSATDGLYQVADCGGAEHGVLLAGEYKILRIAPNPASDRLTIDYALGHDGPITIDVYDQLGRSVKHFEWPLQKQGQHTATVDCSNLSPGRYVYRLESLDYKSSGSVLLVR